LSTSLPYDIAMSASSATGYIPLDSDAPTIFSEALADNYMNAGFLVRYFNAKLAS
jgi:hypothetical protein